MGGKVLATNAVLQHSIFFELTSQAASPIRALNSDGKYQNLSMTKRAMAGISLFLKIYMCGCKCTNSVRGSGIVNSWDNIFIISVEAFGRCIMAGRYRFERKKGD